MKVRWEKYVPAIEKINEYQERHEIPPSDQI